MIYPADDLDRIGQLLQLLSSYWVRTYGGQDQVENLLRVVGLQLRDVQNLQEDLEKTTSRRETPVFHRKRWQSLTVKASDRNQNGSATALYGEGYVFGVDPNTGVELKFGGPRPVKTTAFNLPSTLVDISLITDKIEHPTVALFPDFDFKYDAARQAIVFDQNPFDGPWKQDPVFLNGEVVDYSITFWLAGVGFDEQWLWKLWGSVLNIFEESSEQYRELLNAVFDSLVGGGVWQPIYRMLSLTTDIPLATSRETVELLSQDDEGKLVVTNNSCYRYNSTLTPVVAVGDTLRPGQAITSGLRVATFHNGVAPDWLRALTLDKTWLKCGVMDALVFLNEDVALTVNSSHPSGKTYVSYTLGGQPADAKTFFDYCQAQGVAAGKTLANYLDLRSNPTTEPTEVNLPSTINPLQFLVENWLRNNVAVAQVVPNGFGRNALGIDNLSWVTDMIPPRAALIVIANWTFPSETALASDSNLEFGYGWDSFREQGFLHDGGLKFKVAAGAC